MEKKDRIKKDISRESYLQTVIRRFKQHHLATVSLVILAVLVVAALLAPIIAPYNPDEIVGGFSKAPTAEHWLGTDQIGRDVLSRLLYATRISLLVGVLATAISTDRCDSGTDRRVFWRRCGYDYHALYGYGHVVSLHFTGAGCGVDF